MKKILFLLSTILLGVPVLLADEPSGTVGATDKGINGYLDELGKKHWLSELVWLRKNVDNPKVEEAAFWATIQIMKSEAAEGDETGFTLKDLGTSKKELSTLLHRHRKVLGLEKR